MLRTLSTATILCLAATAPQAATYNYSFTGSALADYCDDERPCTLNPIDGVDVSQASPHSFGANTLDLSAAPRLTATGAASFSAGGSSSASFASRGGGTVSLDYFMVVNGSGGLTSVPVQTIAEAAIEVSGGPTNFASANAGAQLSIVGAEGALLNLGVTRAYDQYSSGGSYADGFSVDQLLSFEVGEVYQIRMRVNAGANVGYGGAYFTSGPFAASAYLDPYFVLPDSYAALGYSLEFSGGISNIPVGTEPPPPPPPAPIPLPAGAPLLGAGLVALALARRRHRGHR